MWFCKKKLKKRWFCDFRSKKILFFIGLGSISEKPSVPSIFYRRPCTESYQIIRLICFKVWKGLMLIESCSESTFCISTTLKSLLNDQYYIFSNSRSPERPVLIIETLEYIYISSKNLLNIFSSHKSTNFIQILQILQIYRFYEFYTSNGFVFIFSNI